MQLLLLLLLLLFAVRFEERLQKEPFLFIVRQFAREIEELRGWSLFSASNFVCHLDKHAQHGSGASSAGKLKSISSKSFDLALDVW